MPHAQTNLIVTTGFLELQCNFRSLKSLCPLQKLQDAVCFFKMNNKPFKMDAPPMRVHSCDSPEVAFPAVSGDLDNVNKFQIADALNHSGLPPCPPLCSPSLQMTTFSPSLQLLASSSSSLTSSSSLHLINPPSSLSPSSQSSLSLPPQVVEQITDECRSNEEAIIKLQPQEDGLADEQLRLSSSSSSSHEVPRKQLEDPPTATNLDASKEEPMQIELLPDDPFFFNSQSPEVR